jgi:HlyD family secretion protein
LSAISGAAWYYLSHEQPENNQFTLSGNIDVRQVNLAFKVEGRIESLAVDEGDHVVPGQVLATLDKRYFADELRLAKARRDNSAANLARLENGSRPEEIAQARAEHSSVKFAAAALRLAEIGPRREDIDAARAMLGQQEAMLVQTERRLADADLVSPNDGTILTRARERGAIVQSGETVFTLTLSAPVWVRAYVYEPDLGLIHPGMVAQVYTDSNPSRPVQARVGFISPTAEFTPKTVETNELRTSLVYRLRIVIDQPDDQLRQGMPVTVRFEGLKSRSKSRWERLWDSPPWTHLGFR